jgi:hypothetical protein
MLAQDTFIYAYSKDDPCQSIQLSRQIIGASKVISEMLEDGARKTRKIKMPFDKILINHVQAYIQNKAYLNLLSINRIEQLYQLSNFLEFDPQHHDPLADILWSEWNSGHQITTDVLSRMKQYVQFSKNQSLYKKVFDYFLNKINPISRQYQNINFDTVMVGQKYVGFWEQKNSWFASVYPQFIAHFMPIKKIFEGHAISLEDKIRENAQISIPLIISNINQNSLVFRDDQKGFTFVECKKNGALHRWENGLKTYYSNFENVVDVCHAPSYGYYVLYQRKHSFQVLFFEFKDNEKQYVSKEYFPYSPWFLDCPDFDVNKPCLFLEWDSSYNTCKLFGKDKDNTENIYFYQCKFSNGNPQSFGKYKMQPEYNAINQRNCLHKYNHTLTQAVFYSITPNDRLFVDNSLGNLWINNDNEHFSRDLMSYNNQEVYFLSNTVLLVEDNVSMIFFDLKRFNLVKERFELFLSQQN